MFSTILHSYADHSAELTFLRFLDSVPSQIMGVITGLLPAVLLAVLMALVPIICRGKCTMYMCCRFYLISSSGCKTQWRDYNSSSRIKDAGVVYGISSQVAELLH